METNLEQKSLKQTIRQYGIVVAFVVCIIAVAGYMGTYYQKDTTLPVANEVVADVTSFARSQPVRITIPAVSIDTTFVPPLQLNPDKTIMVPDSYTQVGWYAQGATPGELGASVILGHVDSTDGPAIFYPLGRLKKGDTIEVSREDGTKAVFEVNELVRYPQDSFPTEKVYGKTDVPTLRLVTCTGTFDKGVQRYSHNLVVYATLKEM